MKIAKHAGLQYGSVSPAYDSNRHNHHNRHQRYGNQDRQFPEVTRQTLHHRCLQTNSHTHRLEINRLIHNVCTLFPSVASPAHSLTVIQLPSVSYCLWLAPNELNLSSAVALIWEIKPPLLGLIVYYSYKTGALLISGRQTGLDAPVESSVNLCKLSTPKSPAVSLAWCEIAIDLIWKNKSALSYSHSLVPY